MAATRAPENKARARRRQRDDPVVVGGLSATGRSSVAALLSTYGVRFPGPLSAEHVSPWFTLLFKRPSWVAKLRAGKRPIPAGVADMQVLGSLLNGARLPQRQLSRLATAAAEVAAVGYERHEDMPWWPPSAPFRQIQDYLARPPREADNVPWGWSHPLSHLFLEEMAAAFSGLRFVYVVRHPLDTAVAWTRTDHLRLWGSLCGLNDAKIKASPMSAQLAFWLYSTRTTVEAGRRLLGDRFLLVWAEQLVEHPVGVARQIAAFAGVSPEDDRLKQAARLVGELAGVGSWRELPLDQLDSDMVKRVLAWVPPISAGAATQRADAGPPGTTEALPPSA